MVTSDDDIELVTSDGDGVLGADNNVKISLEPVLSWSLSRVSWSRVESCATFLVNTDTDSNILSLHTHLVTTTHDQRLQHN